MVNTKLIAQLDDLGIVHRVFVLIIYISQPRSQMKYWLKHQNEFFQGMKVLKLYAWEKPLMGKVIVNLLASE